MIANGSIQKYIQSIQERGVKAETEVILSFSKDFYFLILRLTLKIENFAGHLETKMC